ncbi:MAG: hypothetical protein K8H86_13025 [Ignavibacteriaceae bacterium]|nr:hypothetical protein [Ignavibacteriaceae bacterium]
MQQNSKNIKYPVPDELNNPQPKQKYFKVVKSDIYKNKRIYPEGSIVDFFEPSLKEYLEPVSGPVKTIPEKPISLNTKRDRGRPKKN